MIYFENETLQFPRHSGETSNKLIVINELTGESNTLDFVDLSQDERYYLIDLSNVVLKEGTYRYEIGPEIGLMQVGDYVAQTTEYNEKKQNVVYER